MSNHPEIVTAVEALRAGELVAFPTETVYGLGADARNEAAIQRVFAVKGRPVSHPLIVHIASFDQVKDWAQNVPPEALILAQHYWPGPLTLILKKQPWVSAAITGGQDTVALRVPNHPLAQALLQAFGGGLVGPSANRYTHVSPTTAQAVYEELGAQVAMILDGGACEVGLESTIIDLSQGSPAVLRLGMISVPDIEKVLGKTVQIPALSQETVRAPGRKFCHYAPQTPVELVATDHFLDRCHALLAQKKRVAALYFSSLNLPKETILQPISSDPALYAHDFYHFLRLLDHAQTDVIMIENVPENSEWAAISDRLQKASGRAQEIR